MENVAHWTQQSTADFVYGIAATFVAQIETKMEEGDVSRSEIAKRLNKTSGRVSQILNNPGNLGLKVMVETAGSLGMKVGVIAYDDHDPTNENGPIDPDVFVKCWERAGRPANLFEIEGASAYDIWSMYLDNQIGTDLLNKAAGQILEYGASFQVYSGGFGGLYEPTRFVEPLGLLQRFQLGQPQASKPNEPWQKSFQPELSGFLEKWHPQQSTTLIPKEEVA
jgi:hypothetical protein